MVVHHQILTTLAVAFHLALTRKQSAIYLQQWPRLCRVCFHTNDQWAKERKYWIEEIETEEEGEDVGPAHRHQIHFYAIE